MQVIEVQGHDLERDYVRQWASDFELLDLAEEAFGEASPPDLQFADDRSIPHSQVVE